MLEGEAVAALAQARAMRLIRGEGLPLWMLIHVFSSIFRCRRLASFPMRSESLETSACGAVASRGCPRHVWKRPSSLSEGSRLPGTFLTYPGGLLDAAVDRQARSARRSVAH